MCPVCGKLKMLAVSWSVLISQWDCTGPAADMLAVTGLTAVSACCVAFALHEIWSELMYVAQSE